MFPVLFLAHSTNTCCRIAPDSPGLQSVPLTTPEGPSTPRADTPPPHPGSSQPCSFRTVSGLLNLSAKPWTCVSSCLLDVPHHRYVLAQLTVCSPSCFLPGSLSQGGPSAHPHVGLDPGHCPLPPPPNPVPRQTVRPESHPSCPLLFFVHACFSTFTAPPQLRPPSPQPSPRPPSLHCLPLQCIPHTALERSSTCRTGLVPALFKIL